jgi:hypothetical protein
MQNDPQKFRKIFDYLYTSSAQLKPADGLFVFCRDNPLMAAKAAELYKRGLGKYIVFTGGLGSDSGFLARLKCPEAVFQSALARLLHGIPAETIYTEDKARNGLENSRLGLQLILDKDLPHQRLILVCHPVQLRRLAAAHLRISQELGIECNYQLAATDYQFSADNLGDQRECVKEILRLAEWPGRGIIDSLPDLPAELVEYAATVNKSWQISI